MKQSYFIKTVVLSIMLSSLCHSSVVASEFVELRSIPTSSLTESSPLIALSSKDKSDDNFAQGPAVCCMLRPATQVIENIEEQLGPDALINIGQVTMAGGSLGTMMTAAGMAAWAQSSVLSLTALISGTTGALGCAVLGAVCIVWGDNVRQRECQQQLPQRNSIN